MWLRHNKEVNLVELLLNGLLPSQQYYSHFLERDWL